MPAYKDKRTGKWYASFYYKNWKGESERKMKRGFETKKEAQTWEREFLQKQNANLNMPFASFVEIYMEDIKVRIRESTYNTKENIIRKKILPYFENKKMCDITPKDIIKWQNEIMAMKDEKGDGYTKTYLKTTHNQMSAIFNHAVRFYELASNPASKAGSMGEKNNDEMLFWTKEEYTKFSEAIMDKPLSYYAFEILYWCGIREGELLALTPADFDFDKRILRINKSYQRIGQRDVITDPKTRKSKRSIKMPQSLNDYLKYFLDSFYKIKPNDRIFTFTKSYLYLEMKRGTKAAGVKKIRIHDIRHSHVSLLIDLNYSAVAIADRLGHESIEVTYRYAHLFKTRQSEMADRLDEERVVENG